MFLFSLWVGEFSVSRLCEIPLTALSFHFEFYSERTPRKTAGPSAEMRPEPTEEKQCSLYTVAVNTRPFVRALLSFRVEFNYITLLSLTCSCNEIQVHNFILNYCYKFTAIHDVRSFGFQKIFKMGGGRIF